MSTTSHLIRGLVLAMLISTAVQAQSVDGQSLRSEPLPIRSVQIEPGMAPPLREPEPMQAESLQGGAPPTPAADKNRVTRVAGGSNYHWFGDDGLCAYNSRDNFGLLTRYHQYDPALGSVREVARAQMAAMHQRGMRRLSLGVFFVRGFSDGVVIDADNPVQVAQVSSNLALVLADARMIGYEEVLFRFFAINNMNPAFDEFPPCCDSTFDAHVDSYWNLIRQIRPALVASGMPYRIDLMVEGAPRDSDSSWLPSDERYKYPANRTWSTATRTLWQRYYAAWGADDTVGFSFIVDNDPRRLRSRVRHMRYIYEGNYPYVFAIDFYGNANMDEYQKFMAMDGFMRSQNPPGASWDRTSWIIAEAFYEDPLAAEGLARAIRESQRDVLYLTQWPQDRAAACVIEHVNTPPPFDWTVWGRYGF